ncbi:MAG: hypothetical protein Q8P41_31225 [Pseudomonadota bacterium]|nr:hypothetical protein [Pseudomonadota bacterium]
MDLLLPVGAAVVTTGWHVRWLGRDDALPVGDAAGHLINVMRHVAWLDGERLPTEAFPPGVYVVGAALVRLFGRDLDVATASVALFAGLLAAALAFIGQRASGRLAGALLPMLALTSPILATYGRVLLLDLPMTALVVWIWALTWASRGFRVPAPTVLVGVALGVGALVKYTLFPWVLPALLFAGIAMVLRSPASLLPLAVAAAPIYAVGVTLWERADGTRATASGVGLLLGNLGGAAAILAGTLALEALRGPRARPRHRAGLVDGAWLGLAMLAAVAIVTPWFLQAMPLVAEKVLREAVTEVRTSPVRDAVKFAVALVVVSWPKAWWAFQVAFVVEAVALGMALGAWRARAAVPPATPPAGASAQPGFRLGPSPLVMVCCLFGAWVTVRTLPVDARYQLPLVAGAAIVLGLAACRFHHTRLVLAPLVALTVCAQLLAAEGHLPARTLVVDLERFDVRAALSPAPWRWHVPPPPHADPLAAALDGLAAVTATIETPLGREHVLIATPAFGVARSIGLEARGLGATAMLHGLPECHLVYWEGGAPPARGAQATVLVVAALLPGELAQSLAAVPVVPGDPLLTLDTAGRALRLYRLDPSAIPAPTAQVTVAPDFGTLPP